MNELSIRGMTIALAGAACMIGCAAGGDGTGGDSSATAGGGGAMNMFTAEGAGPATGSGGAGPSSTNAASTSSSSGSGGTTVIGNYGPSDMPAFKTAMELCAFVNTQREGYSNHDRFRGPPWVGEYHMMVTWPIDLTIDPALTSEAEATANALASGSPPMGAPYSDGDPPPHEYLYVSGVDTSHYVIASEEQAGDWTADIAGNIHAGITETNGTARMALFYHDAGGQGPVLTRLGCGGARAKNGASWWWVVSLAP